LFPASRSDADYPGPLLQLKIGGMNDVFDSGLFDIIFSDMPVAE
jgi:hypothetical protein